MAQYTDKGIQFNNIDVRFSANNKKLGNAENVGATDEDLIDIASDNGGKLPTIVNTVEIDWNNAQLQSAVQSLESNLQEGLAISEINTSGELIKVIAQLQAQVNTLTTLVKGLYNAIQTQS